MLAGDTLGAQPSLFAPSSSLLSVSLSSNVLSRDSQNGFSLPKLPSFTEEDDGFGYLFEEKVQIVNEVKKVSVIDTTLSHATSKNITESKPQMTEFLKKNVDPIINDSNVSEEVSSLNDIENESSDNEIDQDTAFKNREISANDPRLSKNNLTSSISRFYASLKDNFPNENPDTPAVPVITLDGLDADDEKSEQVLFDARKKNVAKFQEKMNAICSKYNHTFIESRILDINSLKPMVVDDDIARDLRELETNPPDFEADEKRRQEERRFVKRVKKGPPSLQQELVDQQKLSDDSDRAAPSPHSSPGHLVRRYQQEILYDTPTHISYSVRKQRPPEPYLYDGQYTQQRVVSLMSSQDASIHCHGKEHCNKPFCFSCLNFS